jgi:hypothetical protein
MHTSINTWFLLCNSINLIIASVVEVVVERERQIVQVKLVTERDRLVQYFEF